MPEARHGFWPTDFSAADAVQGLKEYGQLELAADGSLYWLEYRPAEGGRNVLCRYLPETQHIQSLTPEDFSVCSRVHEYGGLSWCLAGEQLYFVNSRDQQLWRQSRLGGTPHPASHETQSRFAAPCWDRQRSRLLAVEELHRDSGVVNRLVAVSGHSGAVEVLHQQHDFYGAPVLSDDGRQLAWVSWDHPDQPWTRTLLYRARIDQAGRLFDIQLVAGQQQPQALTQPMFDRTGQLYAISDRDNWWALYRYPEGASAGSSTVEVQRLLEGDAAEDIEYAAAPWQLGQRTVCLGDAEDWIGCGQADGRGLLLHHNSGQCRRLAEDYSHFRWPVAAAGKLYCVAGSETRLPAILQVSLDDGRCRVISGGGRLLPADGVSRPEHLSFPVGPRERAYAFFYPPGNGRINGSDSLPPLLIVLHGGPTAASYPVLSPMI
ncbi:hypothetical protein [Marinobacterium arenosum]|uniref:hypothetical protein n=1 Tax=Marinobacterium arenosum TaxID=2862496 RepID=UPI001C97F6C9|nr:hypothetical protein [Marinobacterium arenosum]MBY4677621.1 hypothetical protein [Marinobacterium arenosum]